MKDESEKSVALKLNIQKTKIMASGSITSWQIDGETVTDSLYVGSKITAGGDYSHEIRRWLLLGEKAKTRQRMKKQRHHFASNGMYSQSYGFSSSHMWVGP